MKTSLEQTLDILNKGLDAMTRACESLRDQNTLLLKDIEDYRIENSRLNDRLRSNEEERE
jgi:regulator of replication initiation timing